MRGHNRPPKDALTAEERLAKVFQIAMSGKGSAVEALVEITAIAGMSAQNLFSATIEEWCRITRTKNKKNARTYRDSLFRKGWSEVEGEGRRKTFKAGYTEDQITTAIEAMRGEVLASTGGEVLQSTPQEVLDSTPTGTGEYPLEVRTSTPQQVRTSTPASRTRVSYTGEDINNNNSPLRAHEDWIEFRPGPGKTAVISDKGREGWQSRGLDDDQIDLLLIESPPKLNAGDWLTDESFNAKMQMFFAKACRDTKSQDKRYLKGRDLNKKEGEKQRRRPAGSKEALEILRKQKERGGR